MSSIALPSENTTDTLAALRAARNRQNAQKSTGPRTQQGKPRSAQNARTHALTTATPPPPPPPPPQPRPNSIPTQPRRLRKDQQPHEQDDEDRQRGPTARHRAKEKADHRVMDEEIARVKRNIEQRALQARLERQT